MTTLTDWQNFYVIVGSSAGALIGLQFVVTALIAEMPITATEGSDAEAFSTPTIVHFGAVLLAAATICAPWHSLTAVGVLLGTAGFAGLIYAVSITLRLRRQTAYRPYLEDWLCHSVLPILAYTLMLASASVLTFHPQALFGIASAAGLLLFIGIHNAWDAAAYHVFVRSRRRAAHATTSSQEKTTHGN